MFIYKKPAIESGHPVRSEYLVFGQPQIDVDAKQEVLAVLNSNWIGTGAKVKAFEANFKNYKCAEYALALNSCTAGLHLALLATNIKAGDDVLVPTMTFCATANVIEHIGARPVFMDCDAQTMNVTLEEVKKKVTPKTKAVMLVHFAGRGIEEMEAIVVYAKMRNIVVIEDCAHAIETEINGKKAGTFGAVGAFSFYATKNITTAEGGMVIANDEAIAEKVKVLGLHGMSKDAWRRFSDDGYKHYEIEYPGFKYNMTDIQAALGIKQLEKIEEYYKKRVIVRDKYMEALIDLPLDLPAPVPANDRHALHLFPILLDLEKVSITRDQLIMALHKENIGVGVHYRAVHLQPFYARKYGLQPRDFPHANDISERTLSIPLSQYLTEQDTDDVILALKKILTYYAK
jgi:dTDP-4-amino-4,6-dideoxygalactose transaminase